MLLTFMALTAAAQAMPSNENLVLRHSLDTRYTRTTYETACGSSALIVRFSNRRKAWGRVEQFIIAGLALPNIAEQLTRRASGRLIVRIGVMNCGYNERIPEFIGAMETEALQSKRMSLPPNSFFTVRRVGSGWILTFVESQRPIKRPVEGGSALLPNQSLLAQ